MSLNIASSDHSTIYSHPINDGNLIGSYCPDGGPTGGSGGRGCGRKRG